jgi:hypothetical protein
MDDKAFTGGDYGARCYDGRTVISDCVPMKTIEYIRKVGLTVLFAMLSWNVFAAAERFPAVQMPLDEFADAATLADSPSAVSSPAPSAAVSFGAADQGQMVKQEQLAALELADTTQAPIVPKDAVALEVVDTGTSIQVQNPQPVAEMVSPAAEETVAETVALESGINVSASGEVDELSTDAALGVDHQARNYEVMVPVTGVVEKNGQPEEEASAGAASEEIIHLPYAVLLAILALMSMITVARRNG